MATYNANFNHIALSVPDGESAVEWYTKVLGFKVISPLTLTKKTDPQGPLMTAIYGSELNQVKLAILSAGNDVGVEIFEFVDPPYNGPTRRIDWNPNTYTQGGVFHFCFTVPDVEATVAKAVAAGGRIVGQITEPVPGHKACYTQDPWGNTIEVMDCSFNQLFLSNFKTALDKALNQ
ncbi:hypothetical protein BHE90_013840 [Fusarium euwallaceae]|uniref:VOC domain-containing protein n=1 Tax=Fusarium euwallaceae TaxID=1147111 RepID=A0A430L7Q1_9HYPO|nr:hypothetical protein BHE90_013840 [Fusarium euwallaceae]